MVGAQSEVMTKPDPEVLSEALVHLDGAISLGLHSMKGEYDPEEALWGVLRLLFKIRRRLEQERQP